MQSLPEQYELQLDKYPSQLPPEIHNLLVAITILLVFICKK